MAYAPYNRPVSGFFRHSETNASFEYYNNEQPADPAYPHIVYVGPYAEETRAAIVKKTVAYVVVDETDDGLVVEKWPIKQHRSYLK